MVKIRLARGGRKNEPCYRIIVIDASSGRDSAPIEKVGFYQPTKKLYGINVPRVRQRISEGARPTETVCSLLIRALVSSAS